MSTAKRNILISCIIILIVNVIAGFRLLKPTDKNVVAQTISEQFMNGIDSLRNTTEKLHQQAKAVQANDVSSLETLRNTLIKARNQFKEIEYLASYADGEYVKDWLNGPPLPKVERNSPSTLTELEPEGLQILDEMIFDDDEVVWQVKEKIVKKTDVLRNKVKQMKLIYKMLPPFKDFMVFEAMREELVRIFTLGLTGFDVPSSGNSMREAFIALKSTRDAFAGYEEALREKNHSIYKEIIKLFDSGLVYLKDNNDFDSFDRLYFLKRFINPLYAKLLSAHKTLQLPTMKDVNPLPLSINYDADNIFADDFIDKNYYVGYGAGNADEKVIELGKTLFFDPVLSFNNTMSCGSCHQPEKAFTDGEHKSFSADYQDRVERNAPTLINSVYADRYFHDLKQDQLERQIEHVIVARKEFHTTYLDLFEELSQSEEYLQLFTAAFPEHNKQPINQYTLSSAMAAYVKSLSSFNSPFDKYARGEIDTIEAAVYEGFNLFMGKAVCGTCHFAPTFNGTVPPRFQETESEVLAVPVGHDTLTPVLDPDIGRFGNGRFDERSEIFAHSFKTPTVRNAELTAPYMHNGGYKTLEEVMDFYNRGGGVGMGLEVENQTLPFDSLALNKREIHSIISFMQALTDTVGMTSIPKSLPAFPEGSPLNERKVTASYSF